MTPMRRFDPVAVGEWEAAAWVAYYQRRWLAVLRACVGLTRQAFGMGWPATLLGAWWVLLANKRWAPVPANDPAGAERAMRRFYALVAKVHGEDIDPAQAAGLEVRWWRIHRELQRDRVDDDANELVDALEDLYAYVYSADPDAVRPAAQERTPAMRLSDRWVADGCRPDDPVLVQERAALVRSHAALLAAVHVND